MWGMALMEAEHRMSRAVRGIPLLSKSRFMSGLQCHKRLYLECFHRDLADPVSEQQQQLFDSGTEVGKLARTLFPDGVLISEDHMDHQGAMAATQRALASNLVPAIYEAAFLHDGIRIRADVLVPHKGGDFDLVEVKSTTRLKDEHVSDVGIQLYVLLGHGLPVRRASLCHLNREYIYDGGEYKLSELFTLKDITYECTAMQRELPVLLEEMRRDLAKEWPPEIEVGRQCTSPNTCQFYSHCHRNESDYPIEQLPRAEGQLLDALKAAGIRDIHDIPEHFAGLSELQQRVRDCVVTNQPYLNDELPRQLRSLRPPVHFLDFETFNPPLPLYAGTRPYQQVPFQWSLHTLTDDGSLRHAEFLHDGEGDPREPFATSLVDALGDRGPVLVYSSFESARIRELAAAIPALANDLRAIAEGRLVDLLQLVRTHYYHPAFHGSFSIKSVLPAVAPHLDYSDLVIGDGTLASMAYAEMIGADTPQERKREIRKNLLAYCERDTLAEVELFRFFTQ
jgi:predicted RecB family nuclease